jgi:MPBQ/MSBQ methyltransferase
VLEQVGTADWTVQTLPSWRQSVWVGVLDPWPVVKRPQVWYKTTREIVTLERMHRAFDKGLMQYGMMRGTKALSRAPATQQVRRSTCGDDDVAVECVAAFV